MSHFSENGSALSQTCELYHFLPQMYHLTSVWTPKYSRTTTTYVYVLYYMSRVRINLLTVIVFGENIIFSAYYSCTVNHDFSRYPKCYVLSIGILHITPDLYYIHRYPQMCAIIDG